MVNMCLLMVMVMVVMMGGGSVVYGDGDGDCDCDCDYDVLLEPPRTITAILHISPFIPTISILILLTVRHTCTLLLMLVLRIWC